MKCIIFGAGGQLGREWMYQLEHSNQPHFEEFRGFGSREVDITDHSAVARALDAEAPDLIINCAAYTQVDEAEEKKALAERVNSTAVKNLAAQCVERNIKLVHYSTDYIFPGNADDRQNLPEGYPEDHPTNPINWYGTTKLKGEQAIQQAGVPHLIIRVSWLCGQFGSNFVTTMLRLAKDRDSLDVVNDQWGSPTFAKNVVTNSINLLKHNKQGIYNVTSEGLITWYDFAKKIFVYSGIEIEVNPVSSDSFEKKAERPQYSKLSIQKLSDLEESNIIHWEKGLKHLLKQLNK